MAIKQPANSDVNNWLINGHVQTFASQLWPKNLQYFFWNPCKKHYVKTDDGNTLVIDSYEPKNGLESDNEIFIVPGTDGNSDSYYILRMVDKFLNNNFRVHCMNLRGCGREYSLCTKLYHLGLWEDIEVAVDKVTKGKNIFVLGLSLGGHVLLNMIPRTRLPIKAFATISAPLDFTETEKWQSRVHPFYHWYFLRLLIRMGGRFDKNAIHANHLHEFNDLIMAPMHGYKNANDYYQKNSCCFYLQDIQTPTLMIFAKDDPVIPCSQYEQYYYKIEENKHVQLKVCENGGHVGFIRNKSFWAEDYVSQFFRSIHS